jgi:hypothetical protein
MAARARVIELGRAATGKGHPCFAKGTSLKYTYADKEYPVDEVGMGCILMGVSR